MESLAPNPQQKKSEERSDATQAREAKRGGVEVELWPPSSPCTTEIPSSTGKTRKTRSRDSRVTPIPSRAEIQTSSAAQHMSLVVRVDRLRVISVEDANNIRLSKDAAGRAGKPAPSPYEERFLPPTIEEDERPGPSYYSNATCARTLGSSQTPAGSCPVSVADCADERMDADSLGGDIEILMSDEDSLCEDAPPKRGRGRPPTHGEFVGIREKREEEKARERELALEQRAKEALNPEAPKGVRWKRLLEEEEELEEQLRFAPTEDIASQLLEHSAVLFKTADRSNKMKSSLVGKMKQTVALIRAATAVLTRRTRETAETPELCAFRRELANLRAENKELRREIERLKNTSVAQPSLTLTARPKRATASKRRRMIESDDDSDMPARRSPVLGDVREFPPLPTPSGERGGGRMEKITQDAPTPAVLGPSIGGKARPIEPVPPGLSEEERTALSRLRKQRDDVLSQLDPILEKMSQLEVSMRERNLAKLDSTAPITPQVSPVIGKEAKTSKPQGTTGDGPRKPPAAVPAASTAKPQTGDGKKKKGKKSGRAQGSPVRRN